MTFDDLPLDQLGRQAYGHVTAGDKTLDKAEQHYKSAGLYLIEAKARVAKRKDMTWPEFLMQHCRIGPSRANEIISIADGRRTLEEIREEKRESVARVREADKEAREVAASSGGSGRKPKQKQRNDTPPDPRTEVISRIARLLRPLTLDQLLAVERIVPHGRGGGACSHYPSLKVNVAVR